MPATTAPVDNFDEVIKAETPRGFSIMHKAVFAVVAVVASGIPAYIFLSRFFSVDASYLPLFIAMTLICTVVLALCYNKLAAEEFGHVMERKKRYDEKLDEEAGKKEASAYAMFITNVVFEGCVLLLAFVVLPRLSVNIPSYVVYSLVAGIAGAFTFGFSYKYI